MVTNFQVGVNYTVIFKLLGYSLPRLWGSWPGLKQFAFSDQPVTEVSKIVCGILRINEADLLKIYKDVAEIFSAVNFPYHIITMEDARYSRYLKASLNPPPVLFTRGNNDFMAKYPAVSVVGTRQATEAGEKRARKLAILLGDMGFVVTSGLARGIDKAAHLAALETGGRTMAVIGTNLTEWYPPENKTLQDRIASEQLLISQFPFGHPITRANFPTRNKTMSALSLATIVVEAGETSGALIQAQQCLKQNRKLFILKNLIDNQALAWPRKYVGLDNVYVISKIEDLIKELQQFQLLPEKKTIKGDSEMTLFEA